MSTKHDRPFARVAPRLLTLVLFASGVVAQTTFAESEPNSAKVDADGPFVLAPGDAVTGSSTGTTTAAGNGAATSADFFLIQRAAQTPGIYRNSLNLTTPGLFHTASIRGLTVSGGAAVAGSDANLQTVSGVGSPPSTVVWYGFGKGEQFYYRVTGSSLTSQPYTATLNTTSVAPIAVGNLIGGSIKISQVGLTFFDTEIRVYDANFDPVPGFINDNPLFGGTIAELTRDFAPGLYYAAVSRHETCDDQLDPPDSLGASAVCDFPGLLVCSSGGTAPVMGVSFTDCSSQKVFNTTTTLGFEILWFQFTVLPNLSLAMTQPGGPAGPFVMTDAGGVAGNVYVNAVTLNAGLFPNGWLYGVDIPFTEFAAEIMLGAPFVGILDGFGGATHTIPGPIPSGVSVYAVGLEFDPVTLLPKTVCPAPFNYVTL